VRGADRILILDAGRLVQEGHHADLVAADGPYRELAAAYGGLS
jgi:ABC-type multidrug transport system fused ATPase/permease subunit